MMDAHSISISRRVAIVSIATPIVCALASGCGSSEPISAAARNPNGGVSVCDLRFGAKGDGVTDDTRAIQAAIDAANDIFIPAGTYIVSQSLILSDSRRVYGEGAGSVLRKKDEHVGRVLVNASGASKGIILEHLTIDGARQSTAYVGGTDGLFLTRCTNAIVRGIIVRNCLNDGIIIEYGSGNLVTGCVAHDNAKDGIYSSGSHNITIEQNQAHGNLVAGIAVAATSGGLVTKNKLGDNRADIMLARDSRNIDIVKNDCRSATAFVVSGENIAAQTLNGITYPTRPERGWDWLYGASFCKLRHNYLGGEVRLILFNDGEVSDNICVGSRSQGLLLQGALRNRVLHNTIRDWGEGFYGIQLASLNPVDAVPSSQGLPLLSINNTVAGNRLTSHAKRGAIVGANFRNRVVANSIDIPS